jgi:hypothetical protein
MFCYCYCYCYCHCRHILGCLHRRLASSDGYSVDLLFVLEKKIEQKSFIFAKYWKHEYYWKKYHYLSCFSVDLRRKAKR